jgi:nucleoside-diphosphate-sugar epimerase
LIGLSTDSPVGLVDSRENPEQFVMRVILVGGGSFIARHVRPELTAQGCEAISLPHDASLGDALRGSDTVVNFAIAPAAFTAPYDPDIDQDLRVAEAAAEAGCRFVMCSTRRVYGADVRLGAVETDSANGDETQYGRNKAHSEKAAIRICGEQATILRLSNIFGLEYDAGRQRTSFFAQMLRGLRQDGLVRFNMSGLTRRDFLPVEICARAVVTAIQARVGGIFNLGAGFPVTCAALAQAVIAGYGEGRLAVDTDQVRDEFFLNMGKWHSRFPAPIGEPELLAYCTELGRRLRNA